MVRAVVLQSSKTAILLGPRFQLRTTILITRKLEIISHYSNSRALGGIWPLVILNLVSAIKIPDVLSTAIMPPHLGKQQVPPMAWLQATKM